jgi:hypothetical protein
VAAIVRGRAERPPPYRSLLTGPSPGPRADRSCRL